MHFEQEQTESGTENSKVQIARSECSECWRIVSSCRFHFSVCLSSVGSCSNSFLWAVFAVQKAKEPGILYHRAHLHQQRQNGSGRRQRERLAHDGLLHLAAANALGADFSLYGATTFLHANGLEVGLERAARNARGLSAVAPQVL